MCEQAQDMEAETRWLSKILLRFSFSGTGNGGWFNYVYAGVTQSFLILCGCVSLMMCKDACMEMCICDCSQRLCFWMYLCL